MVSQGLQLPRKSWSTETVNVTVDNSDAKDKINKFISEMQRPRRYVERNTEISFGDDGEVETAIYLITEK